MVRFNKYAKPLFIFLLILIILTNPSLAKSNKERIFDKANLLDKREKEDLEVLAEKYSQKRETDFIILTTSDPEGKNVVEYVEDFYDRMALGYDKRHGNVAILTIDMKNRELYLAGFYKGEEYLDKERLDKIRNKITPDLSKGNYFSAFKSFLEISYKYMGIRPGVDPDNILFNLYFQIGAALIIAGISVGAMLYNSAGKAEVFAGTYQDHENSRIISSRDRFIRKTVSRRKKPTNKPHGSGGMPRNTGGGRSSGGHSHSGSRGKF
ncbi:MAG TPA: TPM domain-containing protein [Tissierellaceae bacterium]|nr:TPM domain-containing protein [Tissierellaceae bacterium]